MRNISFFGAAGTVTGSNFVMSDSRGYGILVDMGMFQGDHELEDLNHQPLEFDAREVHSAFLTHAHLDHVGRMPILVKNGFSGKIYMTKPTREIAEIVLMDAAKIMQFDEEKPILYTEDDIVDLLNMVETINYGEVVDLGEISATFHDAGHILGSASIVFGDHVTGKKIAFSGDLGNSPEELVKPTEYIEKADVAVLESTYGDRAHPDQSAEEILAQEMNAVYESRGTLLVPSFSIERTQVLLYKIANFKKAGSIPQDMSVYLDSPMGERVTEVYRRFPALYSQALSDNTKLGDPFSFSGLKVVRNRKESLKIHQSAEPKIIIAGSGMMTGGRILTHAAHYLPMPTTRILIVGFQAQDTIGRQIEEGNKIVEIDGAKVQINATVTAIHSMSAHADQPKLLEWAKHVEGLSKVFLVHGEDGPRRVLKKELEKRGVSEVALPRKADSFELF